MKDTERQLRRLIGELSGIKRDADHALEAAQNALRECEQSRERPKPREWGGRAYLTLDAIEFLDRNGPKLGWFEILIEEPGIRESNDKALVRFHFEEIARG